MPEAKYYKDYNHNYMILESKNDEEGDSYQRRMLVSNKIEGILGCSLRDVNGAVYFYYDISSKVSFENLYKGKQLSYEQVKDFFIQLNMIYQNLGKFFMDERALLVRPDCIYYDLTSRKYFGLYYPMDENKMQSPYEELMDFLLAHIDSGNQNLVDCMYRIYEMSETQNFLLTDALCVFDESEGDTPDVQDIIVESHTIEKIVDSDVIDSEGISVSMPTYINNENYSKDYDDEEYLFLSEEVKKNKKVTDKRGKDKRKKANDICSKKKSSSKYYGFFMVISLCGICGIGWIYFNYKLTKQELMMIVCCLVLMGLCFLFSLIQYFLSGKKAEKAEKEEQELQRDIYDEFRDEKPVVLQDVLDKNIDTNINTKTNFRQEETKGRYGETVFMDLRKQKMEYKLYALDKKNKKHIELTQFPFTIGKMAGCVDCVLTDDSISRLHARIEKQDEKVLLTDMNSTNGTYKNGLRMEPSETVELEPGDEIRFGKLNYCYR